MNETLVTDWSCPVNDGGDSGEGPGRADKEEKYRIFRIVFYMSAQISQQPCSQLGDVVTQVQQLELARLRMNNKQKQQCQKIIP